MAILTVAEWMMLAEEARALADELTDMGAKATMLRIAEGYDRLAEHAARWAQAHAAAGQDRER